MKNQFRIVILVGVMILGVLLLQSCGSSSKKAGKINPAQDTFSSDKNNIISVRVMTVKLENSEVERLYSSVLTAQKKVVLKARSQGEITSIAVKDIGDMINENEILAEIDSRVAKAQYDQSKVGLDNARLFYQRTNDLYQKKLASKQQIEDADLRLKSAEAGYKLAAIQKENSQVKAVFDGYISGKYVESGDVVMPGTPLFEIIYLDKLEAIINVAPNDIYSLSKSAPIKIHVENISYDIPGRIINISAQANSFTKNFPVIIEVNNLQHRLKAEMLADVFVGMRAMRNVIMVPIEAIIIDEGQEYAYVVVNKIAKKIIVKTGDSVGDKLLIKSGLKFNDQLIIVGQKNIADGSKVEIIQ